MTVPSATSRISYAGGGSPVYPVPFRFLADAHLLVTVLAADGTEAALALSTDYSVTGAGDPAGGSVTLLAGPPPSGATVIITRNVPITQETDYVENDAFLAESHEDALDKLTMIAQQQAETLSRALTLPVSAEGVSAQLPTPEASALIGWNAAGDGLRNVPPGEVASVAAYADWEAQSFLCNGTQSDFPLTGFVANEAAADVSIDGVTLVLGDDYGFVSSGGITTLQLYAAPPADAVLAIRWGTSLPALPSALGIDYTPPASGAVTRTVASKLAEVYVSPEDFGAKGDFNPETYSGTNDAAAWDAMLNWVRTQVARDGFGVSLAVPDRDQFTKFVIRCRPGAIYRVDSTLNFTGLRSRGVHVMGNGATIYAYGINNKPVIDAIWSRGLYVHDLMVYAENGTYSGSGVQPTYGIVIGRKNSDDASEHHFENVRVVGWFNRACIMNISSELVAWTKCNFENYMNTSSDFTGLAVHVTDTVEGGFTSDFQTIGSLPAFGMNDNLFTQCNMQSANGPVIRLNGVTRSLKFSNCYAAATSANPVTVIRGDHYKLELDIDCETSAATASVEFDVVSNNCNIFGFRLRDHAPQAQHLMRCRTGIGTAFIYSGEIEVDAWTGANAATARLAENTPINFHGEIRVNSTASNLHNFSGFSAIRAIIYTAATFATITSLPGAGYIVVYSRQETEPQLQGIGGVALRAIGAIRANEYRDSPGNKVLGARITGWGAPTGTATRTAFDTATVTLPQLAERVKALIDDSRTHGFIGN